MRFNLKSSWFGEARWRWHLFALAAYGLLAACFIDHGESLTREIAGQGSDPFAFIWFLAWWPWALSHRIDPLFTTLVWQPAGVCLTWLTSVPLLSVLGWPLTLLSPVLTFNFFVLLSPILAAFMAYLLCLHLTEKPAAAGIGGFLFGYSSYEMGQDTAVLNLSFTLLVPAMLLIVLRRLEDGLSRQRVILLAALALVSEFLISIEIFAMIFVFGGIAWALAMVYLPERRILLRRLVVDALLTAPLVLLLLSPLLLSMARHAKTVHLPGIWPYYFTTDLLNFVVPSRTNLFGGWFGFISDRFNGGVQEKDGYLGLPLLLIILLFAKEQARLPARRLLLVMFLLLAVLSLGPRLWIGGDYFNVVLPWALLMHLPLLAGALPVRFGLFVSLCAALIASYWLAYPTEQRGQRRRLLLGLAACVFLLPNWHPWRPVPESQFFAAGRTQAALGANARVLLLPFSINGASSYWQAENHFGFVQTGGYLGFPPRSMQDFKAEPELWSNDRTPHFLDDFSGFCAATHTQYVVLGPGTPAALQKAIAALHWTGRVVDDVTIYAVPAAGTATHG